MWINICQIIFYKILDTLKYLIYYVNIDLLTRRVQQHVGGVFKTKRPFFGLS